VDVEATTLERSAGGVVGALAYPTARRIVRCAVVDASPGE